MHKRLQWGMLFVVVLLLIYNVYHFVWLEPAQRRWDMSVHTWAVAIHEEVHVLHHMDDDHHVPPCPPWGCE